MAFITPTTTSSTSNLSTSTGSTTTTQAATDKASLDKNYSQFLTLLTTELKNQDPTSPMDTAQFTQQLVMYSQVEQQIKSNAKLDSLIGLQQSSTTLQAANYVGKKITAAGTNVSLPSGGTAQIGYILPSTAATVQVDIKDKSGNTVRTLNGTTTTGTNTLDWDGKSTYGVAQAGGVYTVNVTAKGTDGNPMTVTTQEIGKVVGVTTDSTGAIQLQLDGGDSVALTNVQGILASA